MSNWTETSCSPKIHELKLPGASLCIVPTSPGHYSASAPGYFRDVPLSSSDVKGAKNEALVALVIHLLVRQRKAGKEE